MSETVFVSTAIPYVNAKPHVGFALELIQADAISRYFRMMGFDVFFLTGTDENSLKNVRAAQELGITTEELCEKNSAAFQALGPALNLSNDDFIRTSHESRHVEGAGKFWSQTRAEDIYKKHYGGLYCVGCEDFYTEKEVPDGLCPEHGTRLEKIEEENYFFQLSAYQQQLVDLIESGKLQIVPETRRNEMLAFAKSGLKDFSISRTRERAGNWGIRVPNDPDQVMYVWYDALTNYITALDYADDGDRMQRYWHNCSKRVHVIGKGINRFHTLYWPAMLMSVGLPTPDTVFVHGYLTVNGEKISKSLGNVIDPIDQVQKYTTDGFRFYLLRAISPFEDGDYSLCLKLFERALQLDPSDSRALNNLGVLKTQLGDPQAGLEIFINILKQEPANQDARVNLKSAMELAGIPAATADGLLAELGAAINDGQS